jgi:hypothetical protein
MSMQALMAVPAPMRDAQWLAYSLQEAIQLEWSTIPPLSVRVLVDQH